MENTAAMSALVLVLLFSMAYQAGAQTKTEDDDDNDIDIPRFIVIITGCVVVLIIVPLVIIIICLVRKNRSLKKEMDLLIVANAGSRPPGDLNGNCQTSKPPGINDEALHASTVTHGLNQQTKAKPKEAKVETDHKILCTSYIKLDLHDTATKTGLLKETVGDGHESDDNGYIQPDGNEDVKQDTDGSLYTQPDEATSTTADAKKANDNICSQTDTGGPQKSSIRYANVDSDNLTSGHYHCAVSPDEEGTQLYSDLQQEVVYSEVPERRSRNSVADTNAALA